MSDTEALAEEDSAISVVGNETSEESVTSSSGNSDESEATLHSECEGDRGDGNLLDDVTERSLPPIPPCTSEKKADLRKLHGEINSMCARYFNGDDDDEEEDLTVQEHLISFSNWLLADACLLLNRNDSSSVVASGYQVCYARDDLTTSVKFLRSLKSPTTVALKPWKHLEYIFLFVGLNNDGTRIGTSSLTAGSRRNMLCHIILLVRFGLFQAGRTFDESAGVGKALGRSLHLLKSVASNDGRSPQKLLSKHTKVNRVLQQYPRLIKLLCEDLENVRLLLVMHIIFNYRSKSVSPTSRPLPALPPPLSNAYLL